jgi:GNAT superfamily N-acetyltransferase
VFRAWETLRGHYAAIDSRIEPAPVSEGEFAADLERRCARGDLALIVAYSGQELAGFITGAIEPGQPDRMPEKHGTVGHLFVWPQHRRQNCARLLFEALVEWAVTTAAVHHFEMPVLANDPDAVHFWRSLGFSPFIERLWAPLPARA